MVTVCRRSGGPYLTGHKRNTSKDLVDSVERQLLFFFYTRYSDREENDMSDHKISAVKVGPFIAGSITERKPRTREDRKVALISWIITVCFIAQAAPFVGFVLVIGTAIFLAVHTAPSDPDERTQP
jgi:hypothetical protein